MTILLAIVIGLIAGWLGSLAMRSDSRNAILLDLAGGLVGGLAGMVLFGSDYPFDAALASGLGALLVVALLAIGRRARAR